MIKETCSCGATFEVDWTQEPHEVDAVSVWRWKHVHEPQTVAQPLPKVSSEEIMKAMGWSTMPVTLVKGPTWYAEGEHWVWGEDDRVWVGDRAQPADFAEWDKRWPKSEYGASHMRPGDTA